MTRVLVGDAFGVLALTLAFCLYRRRVSFVGAARESARPP